MLFIYGATFGWILASGLWAIPVKNDYKPGTQGTFVFLESKIDIFKEWVNEFMNVYLTDFWQDINIY